MNDDIVTLVTRLRKPMWIGRYTPTLRTDALRLEAADRIEALEAELSRMSSMSARLWLESADLDAIRAGGDEYT